VSRLWIISGHVCRWSASRGCYWFRFSRLVQRASLLWDASGSCRLYCVSLVTDRAACANWRAGLKWNRSSCVCPSGLCLRGRLWRSDRWPAGLEGEPGVGRVGGGGGRRERRYRRPSCAVDSWSSCFSFACGMSGQRKTGKLFNFESRFCSSRAWLWMSLILYRQFRNFVRVWIFARNIFWKRYILSWSKSVISSIWMVKCSFPVLVPV
jgi:hypothetical protein